MSDKTGIKTEIKTGILYSTDGCHLCTQVIEMLSAAGRGHLVEVVDIVADARLVELYGVRIPVVKNIRSGAELGWPFESRQLLDFLGVI